MYRWWGSARGHVRTVYIHFIEVTFGGCLRREIKPFLRRQHSLAPILYLQLCYLACVVFHSFFRNCLQEWSVYMCQIVCSIADTCSAAGCMLSEINTQEIYSPADTNYKTARGCQHTLELNYSDVIYLIHYYFGLYSSFMKKLHILPNINGLFLRHTESQ